MTSQSPPPFSGFHQDNLNLIRLPETFFTQLLPLIDDLTQLQLLLYLFWHLEQQQTNIRYFRLSNLASDPVLMQMVGSQEALSTAMDDLVKVGAVLKAELRDLEKTYYFINGPQGRAAADAIAQGDWRDIEQNNLPIQMTNEPPNIYKLYEENIGPITPMIAEILKTDENTYPVLWIKEAIEIAVTRNVRNWKYVQAILERWQTEGRGNEQNRRNDTQDPSSYRESWLGQD